MRHDKPLSRGKLQAPHVKKYNQAKHILCARAHAHPLSTQSDETHLGSERKEPKSEVVQECIYRHPLQQAPIKGGGIGGEDLNVLVGKPQT